MKKVFSILGRKFTLGISKDLTSDFIFGFLFRYDYMIGFSLNACIGKWCIYMEEVEE